LIADIGTMKRRKKQSNVLTDRVDWQIISETSSCNALPLMVFYVRRRDTFRADIGSLYQKRLEICVSTRK
jgi:hypothetical protein